MKLGLYRNNGKYNGNYYDIRVILGLYRDNARENGNYCTGLYKDYGVKLV